MACCEHWTEHDTDLQQRATSLAWSALRSLTAGLVGSCPVQLRPCLSDTRCGRCDPLTSYVSPPNDAELRACRQSGTCSCSTMHTITLPGRVAALLGVILDGVELDLGLFRIDNGRELVRQDGIAFPHCQDMSLPAGAVGTLVVEYLPGIAPDSSGLWAAGLLACEFARACTGGKCRLPRAVTSIARQGVSMEFPRTMWEHGTGIQEVDAYVFDVNPHRLKTPPMVWSPDMASAKHRVTTYVPPVTP